MSILALGIVDWFGFGTNLWISGLVIVAALGLTMVVAFLLDNHSIIDIVWGPGFVAVGIESFLASTTSPTADPARRALMLAAVSMWGCRLGWHIGRRNRGHVDPRYAKMMQRKQGSEFWFAMRTIYGPQGIAMWIVSLPVQIAMYQSAELSLLNYVGVGVWAVGFGFETIGDCQLNRFKADPANQNKILDRGLWGWTRHPNYFGDAMVWWGIWIIAVASWAAVATIVSPILMTFLLVRVTGAALTDKMMARRRGPEFEWYTDRVSAFVPRPPRDR